MRAVRGVELIAPSVSGADLASTHRCCGCSAEMINSSPIGVLRLARQPRQERRGWRVRATR
jgi:hypothetical protein